APSSSCARSSHLGLLSKTPTLNDCLIRPVAASTTLRHAFLSQATSSKLPSPIGATPDGSILLSSVPVSAVKKRIGGWTISTCPSCALTARAESNRLSPRIGRDDADRIRDIFLSF